MISHRCACIGASALPHSKDHTNGITFYFQVFAMVYYTSFGCKVLQSLASVEVVPNFMLIKPNFHVWVPTKQELSEKLFATDSPVLTRLSKNWLHLAKVNTVLYPCKTWFHNSVEKKKEAQIAFYLECFVMAWANDQSPWTIAGKAKRKGGNALEKQCTNNGPRKILVI